MIILTNSSALYIEISIKLRRFFSNNIKRKNCRSNRWQVFFKISALKNTAILTGNTCVEVSFEQSCSNFIKKRLQHRCFPVNIAKFLRTAFFIEHIQWLPPKLLKFSLKFIFFSGPPLNDYQKVNYSFIA